MGQPVLPVSRCVGAAVVACLAVGCSGSGTVRFISLHPSEIDPPQTQAWCYPAQECYWWVDDGGDLNIAMTCRKRSVLLGKYGRVDLDLSFVLDRPPAGSGRNYPIGRRETRTLFRSAWQNLRLISYKGIVGVTVRDDGTVRGSFRIWVTAKMGLRLFSFPPHGPGPLLCTGQFTAVRDAERGKAIRSHCESGGWARPPRKAPTTTRRATRRPATTER
jgi:hypothetical protein